MDEINEIVGDFEDSTGVNPLAEAKTNGDLFNWLAWFAYEETARKILAELDIEI